MAGLFAAKWEKTLGSADVAAGTTETTSAVIDAADAEEVVFELNLGDCTSGSVITCTVKENTASSVSSPTPSQVALTAVTSSGPSTAVVITSGSVVVTAGASDCDDKTVLISVAGSALTKRYCFLSVTPATQNAAINNIDIYVKRRNHPVTQTSSVISTAYAV